jgi:serine/threonine protein kinase
VPFLEESFLRVRPLGRGAFGQVYLVRRVADGAEFVDKHIATSGLTDKDLKEINKEISVLKLLRHRYIASYGNAFTEDDGTHIILEYAPGGTLQVKN